MTDKIVLNKALGTYDVVQINNNFDKIADALNEKVLYRANPSNLTNVMKNPLDMNGNQILNLPAPTSDNGAARLKDVQNAIAGLAAQTANLIHFEPTSIVKANNIQGAIEEIAGYLLVNVKWFGAKGDGVTDDTAAFTAAINFLMIAGGGKLTIPRGTFKLNGVSSGDGFVNGILLPDTNGDFSTKNGIIIEGEGVNTVLLAGSPNMVVIRGARLYSSIRDLKIDGNNLSQVHGIDLCPESLNQTTELTSQSFQRVSDVYIERCTHGMLLTPGPTVAGSDSGGFYYDVQRCVFNLNTGYDMWFRPDVTAANNRTTRTTIGQCKFLRSVNSVYIQAGTEIDFMNCWWEMWTGTMLNYVPDSAHGANIRLIGGYGESSGSAVGPIATAPQHVSLIEFRHNRTPDASEYKMNKIVQGSWNVAKVANVPARLSFGYSGFADIVADPDSAEVKTLEVQINGAAKKRFSSTGAETFYGTVGNVQFEPSGATITFTRNGSNVLAALGASASLAYQCDAHFWKNAAGTDILSLSATELLARADNTTNLGGAGFRFKTVYAGTGTINTSDEREKDAIQDIDAAVLKAWGKVKFYQFKFKDAIAEKGTDGARWHFGVMAQRVKEAFESEGLDPFAYGVLCYDEWEGGNRYGIRYEEALVLECAYLRSKLGV